MLLKLLLLFLPLGVTLPLLYLIGEGVLDFGAGEKDLLWGFLWGISSIIFLLIGVVLWRRETQLSRWFLRSWIYTLLLLLILWLGLLGYSVISA